MIAAYLLPEANVATAQQKFAALVRRASKLGVPEPKMTECFHSACQKVVEYIGDPENNRTRTYIRNLWRVVIDAEPARLSDWSFIATLNHTSEGNIINSVPGETVPVSFRETKPVCDHCRTIRKRTDTYILRHTDGRHVQVGSNCLADFLGNDPHRMMGWAEALSAFDSWGSASEEDYGVRGEETWTLSGILSITAWIIRHKGWMSKSMSNKIAERDGNGPPPTSSYVSSFLFARTTKDLYEFAKDITNGEKNPSEVDDKLGARAMEWMGALDRNVDNDYLYNLSVVARAGVVTGRTLGLAASGVSAMLRATEERKESETKRPSEFVGVVGERFDADLTLVRKIELPDNGFGPRVLLQLTDEAGNLLSWFTSASSNGAADLVIGETQHVSATVKKHETYKGSKQTQLARAVVWSAEGWASEQSKRAAKAERAAKKAARQTVAKTEN